MSLQFSRSIRVLRLDSFRLARLGLLLAILLLSILMGWFMLAKVTLFENSVSLVFQDDGRFIAVFSAEGYKRLQRGQAALIRLEPGADQANITLRAVVFDLNPDARQAELVVLPGEPLPPGAAGKQQGHAEVEVDYVTPLELLLRATGKALNRVDIPLSPQGPAGGEMGGQ